MKPLVGLLVAVGVAVAVSPVAAQKIVKLAPGQLVTVRDRDLVRGAWLVVRARLVPPDTVRTPPDTIVSPPDTVTSPPDTIRVPPETLTVTDTLVTADSLYCIWPCPPRLWLKKKPVVDTCQVAP